MRFTSTRNPDHTAALSAAIECGLAEDGGLYIPASLPEIDKASLAPHASLAKTADAALAPFFAGDRLQPALTSLSAEAFGFGAPLTPLKGGAETVEVLELFHGPTVAFKDFGARFLAFCMAKLQHGARPVTILVATSGDTGAAVAAAFHRRPGFKVVVLYPKGLVSPRQQRQLECWSDNVHTLAVHGTFDDCQQLVKQAMQDEGLRRQHRFSSANSINIGRLLPQIVYYAASSIDIWRRTRGPASYIVPSGNLGNVMACVWARGMGLPIAEIVLAHNANRAVPELFESGVWRPRPSVATLASAMDVGSPSNMERLRAFYPDVESMRTQLAAVSITDDQIRARIRADFATYGRVWCPHTAVAAEAYAELPHELRRDRHWVIVATAHPAKFAEIVEPLIGEEVSIPANLAALLALPTTSSELSADLPSLRQFLES